tara:strand:+ start:13602 stop:18206 length:4605 start_codon:yes stop_codon:yes gene_type:complete
MIDETKAADLPINESEGIAAGRLRALQSEALQGGATLQEVAAGSRQSEGEVITNAMDPTAVNKGLRTDELEQTSDSLVPWESDSIFQVTDNSAPAVSTAKVSTDAVLLTALKIGMGETGDVYKDSFTSLEGNFGDEVMLANLRKLSLSQTNQVNNTISQINSEMPVGMANQPTIAPTAELYKGFLGLEEAFQDMYYKQGQTPDQLEKMALESQGYYASLLQKSSEKRGVLGTITDGFGLLVDPILYSFDVAELAELAGPDAKGATPLHVVADMVGGFQAAHPATQIEVAPQLIEKIVAASGDNQFKAAAMVGLLFDPDYRVTIGVDVALDATFLQGLGLLKAGHKFVNSVKKMHTIRPKLKSSGSPVEAVAQSEKHIPQVKAAMDADAMDWEKTIQGAGMADDGLAEVYAKVAMQERVKENIQAPMRAAQADDSIIRLNALTTDEKSAFMQSKIDELNKASSDTIAIRKAQVIESNEAGFKISYEVDRLDGSDSIPSVLTLNWTKDAAGTFVGINEDLSKSLSAVYGHKLLSPEVILRTLDDSIVSDVTFGGMQSSVARNSLTKIWKETEKSLLNIPTMTIKNGKPVFARGDARRSVDELLIAGDEAGTVWKYEDLRSGNVQTLTGKRGYSPEEIEAYYAKRAYLDEAHGLQNKQVRDKLNFIGMKNIKWVDEVGKEVSDLGKPIKTLSGLAEDVKIFDTTTGQVGTLASIKARGFGVSERLVKFMKPRNVDGVMTEYGFLRISDDFGSVDELPKNVLNKQTGYVPRISKPGYFYVKNVDGGETLARFKFRENAQAWADKAAFRMNKERVHGEGKPPVTLRAIRDRDFSSIDAVVEDANTFGGLFTGARSTDGIFAGDDLLGEVTRLSAGQSVNRMIENISFQMPMNEYRLAMIQRWKNSAKQLLRQDGVRADAPIMRQIDSDSEWVDVDFADTLDPGTRNVLNSHKEYMIDSLKVAHKDERTFSRLLMDIADRPLMNSKVASKLGLRDKLISVASVDPVQALKGATFDAYLGWFNPRQLFVQTQNAALAMSMHPIHGLTAVPQSLIQRAFLFTPTTEPSLMKAAAKGIYKDQKTIDDMVESVEQFKKSGLRDGVMRTGDYASNLGGFSNGALDSFRSFSAKGRVFFEEGESMARLISWNVARKTWKAANPGKVIDDTALRAIADDTLRMNMNMQRENAAWWQKNAFTSIPTQFLQVQAKLVENMVGSMSGSGKWTKAEAASVLAGQIVLYGTGGTILAEGLAAAGKEGYAGNSLAFAGEMPKLNQFIDRGMTGLFLNSLGFENNFSESGSIVAGLDDNIVWDVASNFSDLMQGNTNTVEFKAPSIGVVQRGADAISSTYQAMADILIAPSMETVGDSVLTSISSFAAITSTWSNARKGLWLHRFGEIQSKDGTLIANAANTEGLSLQTIIARASGFTTDIEDAYYKGQLWEMDRKETEKDTTDAIKSSWHAFRQDSNLGKFQGRMALIMSEYENRPDKARQLLSRALKSLGNPKSKVDKQIKRFITDYIKNGGMLKPTSFQAPLITLPEQAGE